VVVEDATVVTGAVDGVVPAWVVVVARAPGGVEVAEVLDRAWPVR
jgi:hypothetical protein